MYKVLSFVDWNQKKSFFQEILIIYTVFKVTLNNKLFKSVIKSCVYFTELKMFRENRNIIIKLLTTLKKTNCIFSMFLFYSFYLGRTNN